MIGPKKPFNTAFLLLSLEARLRCCGGSFSIGFVGFALKSIVSFWLGNSFDFGLSLLNTYFQDLILHQSQPET